MKYFENKRLEGRGRPKGGAWKEGDVRHFGRKRWEVPISVKDLRPLPIFRLRKEQPAGNGQRTGEGRNV